MDQPASTTTRALPPTATAVTVTPLPLGRDYVVRQPVTTSITRMAPTPTATGSYIATSPVAATTSWGSKTTPGGTGVTSSFRMPARWADATPSGDIQPTMVFPPTPSPSMAYVGNLDFGVPFGSMSSAQFKSEVFQTSPAPQTSSAPAQEPAGQQLQPAQQAPVQVVQHTVNQAPVQMVQQLPQGVVLHQGLPQTITTAPQMHYVMHSQAAPAPAQQQRPAPVTTVTTVMQPQQLMQPVTQIVTQNAQSGESSQMQMHQQVAGSPQIMLVPVPMGQQGQPTMLMQMPHAGPGMMMMAPSVTMQQNQGYAESTAAEGGVLSNYGTVEMQHKAGRQLFNEALDPATLDAVNQATAAGVVLGSPQLPSLGSVMHGTGRCSPCAWYWKPRGCQNGAHCTYCHACPEGELKMRKKAKVAAIRMGALEPSRTHVAVMQGLSAAAAARANLRLNTLL